MFASSALAVLTVDFGRDLNINQIQYYWNSDARQADDAGRQINADPDVVLNVANAATQAKAGADPATDKYVFGAAADEANSQTIRVRVWNGAAQANGGQYTVLRRFGNPALAGVTEPFAVNFTRVRAAPEIPEIFKLTASVVEEGDEETREITFSSQLPARNDNLIVDVGERTWELQYNGEDADVPGDADVDMTLTSANYTFNAGDTYRARVRYENLWGEESADWSRWYPYEVPAGGAGAQNYTLTLRSGAPNTPGFNLFSMPFAGAWYAYEVGDDGGRGDKINVAGPGVAESSQIQNAYHLVNAVNAAAAGNDNVVSTFGRWDNVAQEVDGTVIPGDPPNPEDADAKAALQAINIQQGVGYQVYTLEDNVSFIISSEEPE